LDLELTSPAASITFDGFLVSRCDLPDNKAYSHLDCSNAAFPTFTPFYGYSDIIPKAEQPEGALPFPVVVAMKVDVN